MKALLTKTVNPEHGAGGGGPQPTRTRVRRPSEERAERGVMFKRQMYSSTVV